MLKRKMISTQLPATKAQKRMKLEPELDGVNLQSFSANETVSDAARASIVDYFGSVTKCDASDYHRACLLQFPSSAKSALVEFSKEN